MHRIRRYACWTALLALLPLTTGCSPDQDANTPDEGQGDQARADGNGTWQNVQRETAEAGSAIAEWLLESKDEAMKTADDKIERMEKGLGDLSDRASELSDDARKRYRELQSTLARRLEDARKQAREVREQGAEGWEQSREQLGQAVEKAEDAYNDALEYVQTRQDDGNST
jgi:hypothetical protein